MKPKNLPVLTQKAVAYLRSHYVYAEILKCNKTYGGWKVPEFVIDRGIFSTRTGMRVEGFGPMTLRTLKDYKLLDSPALFPNSYGHDGWWGGKPYQDKVFSLSQYGLECFVLATVIKAVRGEL
jgi:hypothetical protein